MKKIAIACALLTSFVASSVWADAASDLKSRLDKVSILVSDGKTLWFFNPFVEQATATWLKDATSNTPFMLIARNQASDWQQYNIKQNGDEFVLTPKGSNGNLKQFTINVSTNGTINQFGAVEQDDQRSSYQLKSQQNGAVDVSKFTFTPPQGVTVDDQRK